MRKEAGLSLVHLMCVGHESGLLSEQPGLAPVREWGGGGGGLAHSVSCMAPCLCWGRVVSKCLKGHKCQLRPWTS